VVVRTTASAAAVKVGNTALAVEAARRAMACGCYPGGLILTDLVRLGLRERALSNQSEVAGKTCVSPHVSA
jgi:hypothetical protein